MIAYLDNRWGKDGWKPRWPNSVDRGRGSKRHECNRRETGVLKAITKSALQLGLPQQDLPLLYEPGGAIYESVVLESDDIDAGPDMLWGYASAKHPKFFMLIMGCIGIDRDSIPDHRGAPGQRLEGGGGGYCARRS